MSIVSVLDRRSTAGTIGGAHFMRGVRKEFPMLLNVPSYSAMTLLTKVLVFACALLLPLNLASAPTIEIGLKGLSEEKIDILIGQFGRLTTAIEQLASTEQDGVLKTTIDYAFAAFDRSVVCAVDVSVEKAMNRIEKSLPGFDVFRSDHAKACKGETLIPFGSGGLIDRMKFERCVVKQLVATKPVHFAALSSAYSGLKEVANASYCSFQRKPDASAERRLAEANFAATSVLLEAYADLGKINGCMLSTPKALFDCSRKYGASRIAEIKSAHTEDKSSIELRALDKHLAGLAAPTSRRKWEFWNFDFSKEDVLPIQTLEGYEDAISAFRRSSEVIAASKAVRLKAYRRSMDADLATISATATALEPSNETLAKKYIECAGRLGAHCTGLKWPGLVTVKASFDASLSTCLALLQNPRFTDHVNAADRAACKDGSQRSQERLAQVMAHFNKLDSEQQEGARVGASMDRSPSKSR